MAQDILTGGRCRFLLNGLRMGWALNVNVSEDILQEPANVLDMLEPIEYIITGYQVSMDCSIFRLPKKDLVQNGLWPASGRTPDERKSLLIDFPEMSAELWDTHISTPVGKIYRLKPRSRRIGVQARGLVASNITFTCIHYSDEGSSDI